MPTPLTLNSHRKSSSQKRPRTTLPTSTSKPPFRHRKPLSTSDIRIVSSPVTNEGFTTAWSFFVKKLITTYHHDLAIATTPQQNRTISQCFDADICTLLDVYETRIQDAAWQPLGGRVFMDLAYRRFTKVIATAYPCRSALDVEGNAELRKGDDALPVFRRRYLLAEELDRYMAGPRGFLRRAIADRDGELVELWKQDVEMGKSDRERRAKDVLELREENRVLEWIRNINSTEDEYWDIVNRGKVTGKRACGEEEGNRRLSDELRGTGYESTSEIDVEGIPSRLERNDSVIRQQSAKEGGCFFRPDEEADDDDDEEDYYTADEGDDADYTEEENADDQKTNDCTNSDFEYGYDGATEETYGTHSDEETLTGSEAPRRSSRKGSTSSSSDKREAKAEEEEAQQETAAGEGELGSEMAGENRVVAF